MPLLEIEKLTMRFGGLTAVKDVDLSVEPERIDSVIGPNGAGKTTVFNAITGIYEPTEGSIRFAGHELKKPFTWRVAAACGLIGLFTGLVSFIIAHNVDRLWRAAIKRNTADRQQPFSYLAAWRDGRSYLRRELAVERHRARFSVKTPDGRRQLVSARTYDEAEQARVALQEVVNLAGSVEIIKEPDGKWQIRSRDGQRSLLSFDEEDAAEARLHELAQVGAEATAARRLGWLALALGLALGSTGAYAVWNRARRTPDVIALGGIARTFQNIRLFHNMTVLENVLVGMDRKFSGNVLTMMLIPRHLRPAEAAGVKQARELLAFFGLEEKRGMLAKNLPYGDQRRLEIARALACQPKLLLLDEPAAGMNPSESDDLMHLIRKIRDRGVTILLIEHHMKLVMDISDRISVLEYGVKIAAGTPQEVKSNPKVIEAYLGKEEVE